MSARAHRRRLQRRLEQRLRDLAARPSHEELAARNRATRPSRGQRRSLEQAEHGYLDRRFGLWLRALQAIVRLVGGTR